MCVCGQQLGRTIANGTGGRRCFAAARRMAEGAAERYTYRRMSAHNAASTARERQSQCADAYAMKRQRPHDGGR